MTETLKVVIILCIFLLSILMQFLFTYVKNVLMRFFVSESNTYLTYASRKYLRDSGEVSIKIWLQC